VKSTVGVTGPILGSIPGRNGRSARYRADYGEEVEFIQTAYLCTTSTDTDVWGSLVV